MFEEMQSVLRDKFGYEGFRPLQREVIEDVLVGGSRFVILPTGGGKSLAYLLPAHLLAGLTLVVSPLIALMEDQLKRAEAVGLRAAVWSGEVDFEGVQIVFVSPEKLSSMEARDELRRISVDHFVIDEAHSIVGWGATFRPFYGLLKDVINITSPRAISLFSATVDETMKLEIVNELGLEKIRYFNGGFDRENIAFHRLNSATPELFVAELLGEVSGKTIIYCGSRKKVELVSLLLLRYGYQVAPYHAGLKRDKRLLLQQQFSRGEFNILCATSAFGMGVDIPDIRNVIHLQPPNNLEEYYQEVGRAGRDNKKALALLVLKRNWYKNPRKLIGEYLLKWKSSLPNIGISENAFRQTLCKLGDDLYTVESVYAFLLYYGIYVRVINDAGVTIMPAVDWQSKLKKSSLIEIKKRATAKLWVNKFVNGLSCNRSILLDFFQEDVAVCGGCEFCGSDYSYLLGMIKKRVEKKINVIGRLQNYSTKEQMKIINKSKIAVREKMLLKTELNFLRKIV